MRLSLGMAVRACAISVVVVACSKGTPDPPVPSNRGTVDVVVDLVRPAQPEGTFEGTISGHHFTIAIAGGKLVDADRGAYTFGVGTGRVVVQDSGPINDETRHLVARSPRTIVRKSDGLWIVTEVVTIAGGRTFTCLHQETIARDGSAEAQRAAARGVTACASLRVDP